MRIELPHGKTVRDYFSVDGDMYSERHAKGRYFAKSDGSIYQIKDITSPRHIEKMYLEVRYFIEDTDRTERLEDYLGDRLATRDEVKTMKRISKRSKIRRKLLVSNGQLMFTRSPIYSR